MKLKKGEILALDIEAYAFEGKGIARVYLEEEGEKRFTVFVDRTYPGEKVTAVVKKVKSSYAEAAVLGIIKPSPYRIGAKCRHFGDCGGCKAQDLDYAQQLYYKENQVRDIFERIGGFAGFEMEQILGSQKTYYYRNKMEFSFAGKKWLTPDEMKKGKEELGPFALGLHIPGRFDKVLDIEECHLQSNTSNLILNFTKDFFLKRNCDAYSTKSHTGFLRNLIIKQAFHTADLMVNLVTSSENDNLIRDYTEGLVPAVPEITTVVNNINLKKSATAAGDYEKVFYGSGNIFEYLGKYKYRISANSFFQTNTLQAENLYGVVCDYADLKGGEIVFDLYSGAGTISLFISDLCAEVYGFENVPSAVADAGFNAEINNVGNAHFYLADLNKSFLYIAEKFTVSKPDVIITDPPRSGMNPNTVKDILNLNPEKVIYVSCNPATQARDIRLLSEGGYSLIKIKPVDMFPHTYHIENVALLKKHE